MQSKRAECRLLVRTQQHAVTVIWIVLRPGWQTSFR